MRSLYFQEKIKSEKGKFEKQRLEVIDHLKNSWYINEHSQLKDELSKHMEKNGIDLRFKMN